LGGNIRWPDAPDSFYVKINGGVFSAVFVFVTGEIQTGINKNAA
jgi:hypothetical protein